MVVAALLVSGWLGAQGGTYAEGRLIVQLRPGTDAKAWALRQPEMRTWTRLKVGAGMLLIEFDGTAYPAAGLRARYAGDAAVMMVQLDHRLASRRRPDDPRYGQQWQFHNTGQIGGELRADYNTEAAWDFTTGGVTAAGDTIVVASIDNGIDLTHEDLRANLWINRDEIPDNGKDDDRNGYVDDYYGWNTALDNNDVQAGKGDHGTPVMGQIAAVGDNGVGVTGINWRTQVMHITNDFDPLESEVLQAYGYALEARKRYDATGGREGAYVVATNASWGRARAFPSQSPIWCAVYDTLGSYGILNVAAVPNEDIDVDEAGDLPSLCESEYLIVVTSLDTRNKKVANAASGPLSVDVGAFGEEVFTTLPDNRYGAVSGTSYAAPAVTGAVGLLFSSPCANFGELLRSDPPVAARRLRDALLGRLRPVASLAGVTRTGGALDVGAAMQALTVNCRDCLPPTSFAARPPGDGGTDLLLDWKRTASTDRVDLRYRATPAGDWDTLRDVRAPYRLVDLATCQTYELQLLSYCGGATARGEVLTIESAGCCRQPGHFAVEPLAGGRIRAAWEPLLSAVGYTLRYRTGTDPWQEVSTPEATFELTGLRNCRNYEVEIRTDCADGSTAFQQRRRVKTLGCGVCLDADYCPATGFGNEQEWIARVRLPGVLDHPSAREAGGYRNFGDLTTSSMVPGGVYPIELTPDYRGSGFTQDFHVYVDWNQDAVFSEDELVLQQAAARGGTATGSFTVPADAGIGLTRMRVIMQFTAVKTNGCPAGTNQQFSGEVEDYCLDVTPVQGCPPPAAIGATYDGVANATTLSWSASAAPGGSYLLRYRQRGTETFTERRVEATVARIENVNLCSSYEVRVASLCSGLPGGFQTVFLGDDCTGVTNRTLPERQWTLAPNPAREATRVTWDAAVPAASVSLFGPDGRRLAVLRPVAGDRSLTLPLAGYPAGMYTVLLTTTEGKVGSRRVIVP